MSAASTAEALPRGPARIGRYVLGPPIGKGGFAQVYLAKSDGLSRWVAIKLIHSHLIEEEGFVEMFEHEAQVASLLNHPNIVRVLECGREDDFHYIAMDHVRGEPLTRVLAESRHERLESHDPTYWWRFSAAVVSGAARGIHAAHVARGPDGEPLGLVHRDIAPSNIMLTFDGIPTVLDFGIALSSNRSFKTRTGVFKGHISYASPEHLLDGQVDPRSDIWSLGVVLWELLAKRRLFRRSTDVQAIMAIVKEDPPDPRTVREEVPDALAEVAMRALQHDPGERYATAQQLAEELDAYLTDYPGALPREVISKSLKIILPEAEARHDTFITEAAAHLRDPDSQPPPDPIAHDLPSSSVEFRLTTKERLPAPRRRSLARIALVAGSLAIGAGLAYGFGASDDVDEEAPPRLESAAPGDERLASEAAARAAGPSASGAAEPESAPEEPPPSAGGDGAAEEDGEERAGSPEGGAATAGEEATPTMRERPAARGGTRASMGGASMRRAGQGGAVARRPLPRAAPAEPGTVTVATPGAWAEVFVDSRSRGHTPTALSLAPGRHVVELRFPDGSTLRRRVRVSAGERTPLVVRAP